MQLEYTDPAAFFAGQNTKSSNVDNWATGVAVVDLPFGIALALDLSEGGKMVEVPAATGFTFAGVGAFSHAVSNRNLASTDGVPANDAINLKKGGYIAVLVDDTTAASLNGGGSRSVFVRHTDAGANVAGNFRNTADADADALAGAMFTGRVSGTGAGALAEVFLNTP